MLESEDVRQLDRLALPGSSLTPVSGLRQTRARGLGLEFEDFRHYQPGDDPRWIDWTVEARLRQQVVRVFRAEGHTRLHVLLDTSKSMTIGHPSKLHAASKLAAALSYVALQRKDAAGLATFSDRVDARLPPALGRGQLFRLLAMLEHAAANGVSDLDRALVGYATVARGPGAAVVISDFLTDGSTFAGLRFLEYRGLSPAVIQILADEDVDPHIERPVELSDVEQPELPPVPADADAARQYVARIENLCEALKAYCTSRGVPYVRLTTGTSFSNALRACLDAGLLSMA